MTTDNLSSLEAVQTFVEVAIPGIPHPLTYAVPGDLAEISDVGCQVTVSAKSRKATGYIISKPNEAPSFNVKPIIDSRPAFHPEQLELYRWLSSYYGYPLAETIESVLPALGTRRAKRQKGSATPERLTGTVPERLTKEQSAALSTLSENFAKRVFSPFLLFGVTGSGKSEVYLQLLKQLKDEAQGGAIVIVPEIALTPQLIDYFETRLGSEIALLHSELTPRARQEMWQRIYHGELRIVLGARSAIFAPVKDLRLIIVDEEHESSFKQSDTLRYNARDVAVVLGKQRNSLVVLGSATPSLETLVNVKRGNYKVLELKQRANRKPLPKVEIVDLSKIKRSEMISTNISPQLFEALRQTLEAGEQAILLYNRRGFATFLQCESCQTAMLCPNCSVTLTYHREQDQLLCHYCGLRQPPPKRCPVCCDPRTTAIEDEAVEERGILSQRGSGTERVVEELKQLFPDIPLLQMDRDSVCSKESYREILTEMRSGRAKLLVGTQMIAKGHDLPGVTFVGVVDADIGLNTPDFRASERAVQLITQAAGRAGRGELPGTVMIQTRQPNHPAIVAASTGRFMAFARYELEKRQALEYPPWGRLLRIIISSPDSEQAKNGSFKLAKLLDYSIPELLRTLPGSTKFSTLGPAPAQHEKLRGRYRFHLLIKSNSAKALSALANRIQQLRPEFKSYKDLRIAVDVDPVEML